VPANEIKPLAPYQAPEASLKTSQVCRMRFAVLRFAVLRSRFYALRYCTPRTYVSRTYASRFTP
jgi:hypothetical protein